MTRGRQIAVSLALVGVGVVGLLGMQALGVTEPATAPIEAAVAAPAASLVAAQETTPPTDSGQREWARGMMQDHMGLSASEADEWVDEMLEHMAAVHGDEAGAMLDYCAGRGGIAPDGATDGAGTTDAASGYGGMMGGYGGMMGGGYGGMMGGWN